MQASSSDTDKGYLTSARGCVSRGGLARSVRTGQRVVALSFDDGPSRYTLSIVRILKRYQVNATFFEIGRQVTWSYRPVLRALLRNGNTIGDHTWSHPFLTHLSASEIWSQIADTAQRIQRVAGFRPCLMRPPYGDYDSQVGKIATRLGLRAVTWSIDPTDWGRLGTDAIVKRVLDNIRPGRIILLHDGGGDRSETVKALPRILEVLANRHYQVVPVETLLRASMTD